MFTHTCTYTHPYTHTHTHAHTQTHTHTPIHTQTHTHKHIATEVSYLCTNKHMTHRNAHAYIHTEQVDI